MWAPERPSLLALALLAGLALGGCAASEFPSATEDAPPAEPVVEGDESAPFSPVDNPASSPSMPYNGMATLPPVNDDPQQLMGMDSESLVGKLGKPALVRRDGDAEVWQYRADRCVLDLFLYGVDKKVEHVDLRDRGDGDAESVRDCFVGLLRLVTPST